jgi:outer membrane lipoprotein carrier protein
VRPLVFATLFLFALPAEALTSVEQLHAFLDAARTLRAEFEQRVTDADGVRIQESSGTVYIERPGKFRWEYRDAGGQLIVSDGQRLWVYDRDLEQISVRPLQPALGNTPAVVLSGARPIDEVFTLHDDGRRDGLDWVRLRPREEDSSFDELLLGLKGGQLQRMDIHDSFGQRTELLLRDVQVNIPLAPGLFEFTPPPGVDVVGE